MMSLESFDAVCIHTADALHGIGRNPRRVPCRGEYEWRQEDDQDQRGWQCDVRYARHERECDTTDREHDRVCEPDTSAHRGGNGNDREETENEPGVGHPLDSAARRSPLVGVGEA
jgi:hypothetical protein